MNCGPGGWVGTMPIKLEHTDVLVHDKPFYTPSVAAMVAPILSMGTRV